MIICAALTVAWNRIFIGELAWSSVSFGQPWVPLASACNNVAEVDSFASA
jgi:hypothetical protein